MLGRLLRSLQQTARSVPLLVHEAAARTAGTPGGSSSETSWRRVGSAILASATVAGGATFIYKDGEARPWARWERNWDRMEPPKKSRKDGDKEGASGPAPSEEVKAEKEPIRPTRYIVLVRHGQYTDSPEGGILTDFGRQQAELVGDRLAKLPYKFDNIFVSSVSRAMETCDIILKHLPKGSAAAVDPMLAEGAPCVPEPPHPTWHPPPEEFYRESARIEAAFRRHFHRAEAGQTEDTHELLVCHGNVIRYFVMRALQLPPEAWLRLAHINCGITIIRINGKGHCSLETMSDGGHIPPALRTFN